MNNRLAKLNQAFFRNVEFYCEDEKIPEKGRKVAIHDYPNSGKRLVQDLGPLPNSFDVQAVIQGENFIDDAKKFETALDKVGSGILILPHRGAVSVKALPYSINYDHKSIGVIRFNLKFSLSNANEVPEIAIYTVENVYQSGDELRISMQDNYIEKYVLPKTKSNFIISANDYLDGIVNTVQDYSSSITVANSQIEKTVRDVENNIAALVRDPTELANKLIYGTTNLANGLMATFSDAFSTVINIITGESDITKPNPINILSPTTYGANFENNGARIGDIGFPLWDTDTQDRIDRNTNRVLTIETIRFNALILGFEAAANFDYGTTDEITSIIATLEDTYSNLMLNGDSNGIFSQDNNFKILLDQMKAQTYSVLEEKSQQSYSVAPFWAGGLQSVMNLSYKLYAESLDDNTDLEEIAESIVNLNPDQNPTRFHREISVFEV